MQWVLTQQVPNGDLNLIIKMLNEQQDYNADHQKPMPGPYVKDKKSDGPYLRRLEDIDESWVRKYLENVLTGIKTNKVGGMRQYSSKNREARVVTNEDGDTVEEGELLVETSNFAPMDVAEAKAKIPYLLKRLHDKSMIMHVSAISLIIAYERAKMIRPVPGPGEILSEGVYKMGKDGNLNGLFPLSANSGKVFPPACDWIRGLVRDTYFNDAIELIRICHILGIDIKDEDPRDFQAADIAKLKVTYISKNRDYLRGSRQRNLSVLDALSSVHVSDYIPPRPEQVPITTRLMNTIQAVLDSDDDKIRKILNQPPDRQAMNRFFRTYAQVDPGFRISKKQHMESLAVRRRGAITDPKTLLVPVLDDFITRDGFLYSFLRESIPQFFKVTRYVQENRGVEVAVAHSSGYLFLVTEGNCIYYLDVMELEEYIKDDQRGIHTNRYSNNHKYGRWNMCYV